MSSTFSIAAWSGWTPPVADDTSAAPAAGSGQREIDAIPAMLRRRLSPLGRACAGQLLSQLGEGENPPVVYASRHGDADRTLDVLKCLAANEPVSPMNFSLSVHNAICGLVSIHAGLTARISAIAAGDEPLVPALLEAIGMLGPGAPQVLCLICDAPLPPAYAAPEILPAETAVLCLRLSLDRGPALALTAMPGHTVPEPLEPASVLTFLESERQTLDIPHNGMCWQLRKADATP